MNSDLLEEEISTLEDKKPEIRTIFNNAIANQLPLALWRKPLSQDIFMAISLTNDTVVDKCEIETLDSGFLFSPFEVTEDHPSHFIKSDILIRFPRSGARNIEVKNNSSQETIRNLLSGSNNGLNQEELYYSLSLSSSVHTSESDFKTLVRQAMAEIDAGKMVKVVPARCKTIDIKSDFSILAFFEELDKSYPNAFVYIAGIPGVGMWIGATPENLISVDENNIFKTTSLAGTQKYEEGMNLTDAAWRQKEIEEQALVSRYIIDCLKRIRLREFEEIGPKTARAGNLIHLKTDFIVNLNEVNYPRFPTIMLNLLHPTSAVCGTPKAPAMEFIHRYENFERSYFSGFLGPVNIEDQTNIFVNLRCMQFLGKNKAAVYAGAGVTTDSIPEKEWEETELKMDTLLKKMG